MAERADARTPFIYDEFPERFRGQVCHSLRIAIGDYTPYYDMEIPHYWNWTEQPLANDIWFAALELLRAELGLVTRYVDEEDPQGEYEKLILTEISGEQLIDAIEIAIHCASHFAIDPGYTLYPKLAAHRGNAESAVSQINRRFLENDLGYQLMRSDTTYQVIRIDSQYIHAHIVEPAIAALHSHGFRGALDEFMEAHRQYRHGLYKSSMNEALKSFESTIKCICSTRGWEFNEQDPARKLIQTLLANGAFPASLQNYLSAVVSILESAVPTLRNKRSGHGQGIEVLEVPDFLASYMINLTASNIVFMIDAMDASS
jgi:hypothetical protein